MAEKHAKKEGIAPNKTPRYPASSLFRVPLGFALLISSQHLLALSFSLLCPSPNIFP